MDMNLTELIRDVPDFPVPGILFRDITTLLKEGPAFQNVVDRLCDQLSTVKVDRVVAIESRGFIFGAPIAYRLGVGFVPVRKLGKLPADTWETILLGDIPDVQSVPGIGFVDDVFIDASLEQIDGGGGILGFAGPTFIRSGSNLPVAGEMTFDIADFPPGTYGGSAFRNVILHEMGHILGIGTIWTNLGLRTGTGNTLRFKQGNGNGRIRIKALNGTVELCNR